MSGKTHPDLLKAISESDIVHLHGVWDPILLMAARAARKLKIPYLISPHGMLDPWSLAQRRYKKLFARLVTHRHMFNSAAALHALNRTESELWEPLKLRPPATVIPNGIEPQHFSVSTRQRVEELRKRWNLNGCRTILFLGRLHYKKGLDLLADAFAIVARQLPNVHLIVAGPPWGAEEAFQQQIKSAGLTDKVHMTGMITGDTKIDAIHLADVFCLPSRQEGFSISVLEALICKTPVVISQECHLDEVAEVGAGFVCPLQPAAFAEQLIKIISDDQLSRTMSEAGKRWVEANYTWQKINLLMQSLYSNLIQRSSGVSCSGTT